ncbi:hypothetical protein PDESU_02154 [Pontiella desulfatans]|jgi:hypothetical protein|uniref:Uncharacterized protein n=1 Tax=Pontiella desulfatans TaxID=2750659 RepID=A0A6C2U128_PONDE|nr:hypothetical protein [Pontiella desulfatans]VGO13597.1 hypothetical protein PDESU_02154 [Pontiella desulfatans]
MNKVRCSAFRVRHSPWATAGRRRVFLGLVFLAGAFSAFAASPLFLPDVPVTPEAMQLFLGRAGR